MKFKVSEMSCGHCVMTIDKKLKAEGIQDYRVDLESKTVEVLKTDKDAESIKTMIESAGYKVDSIEQ